MPRLILRSGPRAGERVELIGRLVLGRSGADLVIDDPDVSRRHAAIRPLADGIEVEDLGSRNGTFVDGARVNGVVVVDASGTQLQLGDTVIEVELETDAATHVRDRPDERVTKVRTTPEAAAPATAAMT